MFAVWLTSVDGVTIFPKATGCARPKWIGGDWKMERRRKVKRNERGKLETEQKEKNGWVVYHRMCYPFMLLRTRIITIHSRRSQKTNRQW